MKSEVDKYFPRNGPCMFHSTRYARHRLIDALRNQHPERSIAALARDYQLPRAAIRAAVNSTHDDNRMTPKEIREGKEMWRKFNAIMANGKLTEKQKTAAVSAL
jgi:hypothetical protein